MADRLQQWRTTSSGTGGPESLASSSTFIAGYEWIKVDCTTNRQLDVRHDGKIRVGTSPTVNTEIRIYLIASNDASNWPDVFDGTPSAETITSAGVGAGFMRLAASLNVDATTSARDYPYEFNALAVFGGSLPRNYVVFVTHNTGVALDSTAANHTYRTTEIYETIA